MDGDRAEYTARNAADLARRVVADATRARSAAVVIAMQAHMWKPSAAAKGDVFEPFTRVTTSAVPRTTG